MGTQELNLQPCTRMKIIDPGHFYQLTELDGGGGQLLRFVKRIGDGYPGNEAPAYAGTTLQEVIRALIDRLTYVASQALQLKDDDSYYDNIYCIENLRDVLVALEERAARRHGRALPATLPELPEKMPVCPGCGHWGCEGEICGRGSG